MSQAPQEVLRVLKERRNAVAAKELAGVRDGHFLLYNCVPSAMVEAQGSSLVGSLPWRSLSSHSLFPSQHLSHSGHLVFLLFGLPTRP